MSCLDFISLIWAIWGCPRWLSPCLLSLPAVNFATAYLPVDPIQLPIGTLWHFHAHRSLKLSTNPQPSLILSIQNSCCCFWHVLPNFLCVGRTGAGLASWTFGGFKWGCLHHWLGVLDLSGLRGNVLLKGIVFSFGFSFWSFSALWCALTEAATKSWNHGSQAGHPEKWRQAKFLDTSENFHIYDPKGLFHLSMVWFSGPNSALTYIPCSPTVTTMLPFHTHTPHPPLW